MRSHSISDVNKTNSPTDNHASSPLSPSGLSSLLDSSSQAAFSSLLPHSGLAIIQSPTAAAHGPISGVHKLPPRPRPGRKADPNPAPTKKGQSNRLAQQKHRQKKKQLEQQEIERQRRQAEETNRLMRQNAMLLHENQKLRQTHSSPGPLSPAITSNTSPNVSMSLSPQRVLSKSTPKPVPGGCGDCVEGSCPCVDNLLEIQDDDPMDIDPQPVKSPKRSSPRRQRPSLSIQSLLSPAAESPNPLSRATSPRKNQNTQPIHEEHEIDFTSAFRNNQPYDPAMPTGSLTTCGGCPPDDASCLCRKANRVVGSDADSEISSVAHSRATSAAGNDGPGSCARCQADPKQRAWCQGLALETLGSPNTSASDNGDSFGSATSMKNSNTVQYETISCAEAYSVQQRFTDSNKGSRSRPSPPMSAVDLLNSVRERPREYSAFEVDIGTVLSNLKHCKPRRPTDAR